MPGPKWNPLRGVAPPLLGEARLQSHYAAQWLARAARAYVPPRPGDEHTNLGWEYGLAGLATHPFADNVQLALQIPGMSLAVLEGGIVKDRFGLNRRTDAEVRRWLGVQCTARGLDATALDVPSPYDIPDHPIRDGAPYDTSTIADALHELAAWYGNANGTLSSARHEVTARGYAAPDERCWPHHFDLDCLVTFGMGGVGTERSMGIGFSPGDHYYGEPYFYVSVYPGPDVKTLPALPAAGHWHDKDFIAAVATAQAILAQHNPEAAAEDVVRTAVSAGLALFGR